MINTGTFMGNVVRDGECKTLPSGTQAGKITVALNHSFKNKEGQWEKETCFIDVKAWAKNAEFCGRLRKGQQVTVIGRLAQESWTDKNTGTERSKHVIIADTMVLNEREQQESTIEEEMLMLKSSNRPTNKVASMAEFVDNLPF